MKRIPLTLVWILVATVMCSAQTTLYFPQIADGQQGGGVYWTTGIVITNPAATGTAAASGTITFTQDNGTAFIVSFTDLLGNSVGSGNTLPFQLSGGQSSFFVSTAAGSLNVGFATITSSLPVTAGAIFQEHGVVAQGCTNTPQFQCSTFSPSAGVAAVNPLARQASFVYEGEGADTAVAIANPSRSTANVSLQLLTTAGVAAFPAISITLAANNHTAQYLSQLFPNISSPFYGTMQVTSQTPLVTTTLLFKTDGTFSTLPGIPLATTPAPPNNVLLMDNFAQDAALNGGIWGVPQGAGTFFGRTQIRPPSQPPQVVNGVLRLRLDTFNPTALTPGDSFWGSEIDTLQAFPVGTGLSFKASARLEGPIPGGMVGSLFAYALYPSGGTRDEIDAELLTQNPNGVLTNVYQAANFSSAGNPVFVSGGNITDFHLYEVDWYSDHIVWMLDGQLVREVFASVPTQPMTIRLNFWVPDATFPQAFNGSLNPVSNAQQDQTFYYDVAFAEVDRLP